MLKRPWRPAWPARHARDGGFSLVELMVALTLGALVVASVIGFIASALRANAEGLRVARLDEEVHALGGIVASELRRAQSREDPIAQLVQGVFDDATPGGQPPAPSGSCVVFPTREGHRALRRASADGVGALELARSDTEARTCDDTGVVLNSPTVAVSGATFARVGSRRVDVLLEARLRGDVDATPREVATSVAVRSRGRR